MSKTDTEKRGKKTEFVTKTERQILECRTANQVQVNPDHDWYL